MLVGRTIYISGQVGMGPSSEQLVQGGVVKEANQALNYLGEILRAAGCDFANVANDSGTINEIYSVFLG